jgi:molecular chaperone GrpE (heat shock protein)
MKEQILVTIEEVWRQNRTALEDAIAEAIDALENLLRLDEYHRHGHDPKQLGRALGPLASTNLDLGSLSRMLGQGARSRMMAPERVERIEQLIPALGEMKELWSNTALDAASIELSEDEDEVRERAEAYLNRLASVFRALRITQLEVRSKYDSQAHDAVFAHFDWRELGPGEIQSSPPFVVLVRMDGDARPQLQRLVSLLDTGMPLKLVALRSSVRDAPAGLKIETLPLAMRDVHFVQSCSVAPEFEQQVLACLAAPRPGVISLLCPRGDEAQATFESRAERAVRSRAFPICIYDPDRDPSFVMGFDLSSNPSPELPWTMETLSGQDANGQAIELEQPFTFAQFAASEPEFACELTNPPSDSDVLVPLSDYLGFSRRQRLGKLPFLSVLDESGAIVRKVVSPTLVRQSSERIRLWRMLQEISGIDNPHVKRGQTTAQNELRAQHEAELQSLRRELENDVARREKAAVVSAVHKLVARLTGIDPSSN